MKSLIVTLAFLSSAAAWAEVRNPIHTLSRASYDGRTLSVAYVTGGGCQPHTATVEVTLEKTDGQWPSYTANVQVLDVTPAPDYCEALISASTTVDLSALIRAAAAEQGLGASDLWSVSVRLPALESRPFERF